MPASRREAWWPGTGAPAADGWRRNEVLRAGRELSRHGAAAPSPEMLPAFARCPGTPGRSRAGGAPPSHALLSHSETSSRAPMSGSSAGTAEPLDGSVLRRRIRARERRAGAGDQPRRWLPGQSPSGRTGAKRTLDVGASAREGDAADSGSAGAGPRLTPALAGRACASGKFASSTSQTASAACASASEAYTPTISCEGPRAVSDSRYTAQQTIGAARPRALPPCLSQVAMECTQFKGRSISDLCSNVHGGSPVPDRGHDIDGCDIGSTSRSLRAKAAEAGAPPGPPQRTRLSLELAAHRDAPADVAVARSRRLVRRGGRRRERVSREAVGP